MKKHNKWPDFLFTLAVRFIVGAILGAIVSILLCAPISRYAGRRPLLMVIFGDEEHPKRPAYWIAGWTLAGAVMAMLTTPRWQTPWYKYEKIKVFRTDEHGEETSDPQETDKDE